MADLDKLYRLALENAALVRPYRKRFLYDHLLEKLAAAAAGRGKKPILLIPGIRGIGKTTLLLQLFDQHQEAFYFSADSILVKTSTIYALAEQVYRSGYHTLFIDEIHKYPRWTEEVKNIYDDFALQVIATGSSTASLKKGSLLLGRRALELLLSPLTFREFVYLTEGQKFEATIEEVLDKRKALRWIAEHPTVEKHYREYLSWGGFPFRFEEKGAIFKLLKRMIYEDALAEFSLTENKIDVADKLLAFLSVSKLGEFSYTSFSSTSGYAKSTIYEAVQMLKELSILDFIEEESPKSKAQGVLKLLFSHPNLRTAFADQLMKEAELGALREEYFVFHFRQLGYPIFVPKKMKKNPDYLTLINRQRLVVEIGGTAKSSRQLAGQPGLLLDDLQLQVLGFVQRTD